MLTILHPEVLQAISSFAGGLMPIRLGNDEHFSLVVKAQKEVILAAKINVGFAWYLPELPSNTVTTTALISAFFDDADEPLTISTPLFRNDTFSQALIEICGYDDVDIYFFDEQNYEWMSFKTALISSGSNAISSGTSHLLAYHPETAKSMHQAMMNWFGQRTRDDDMRAVQLVFETALSPDDIVILDMRPQANAYLGSTGFRHDTLTRTDAGYSQERDIAACLLRSFAPESIMMNPRRKDNFNEILDHLVLTDTVAILIQAKDSLTTESSLRRSMDRKRRSTHKQVKDAISQINGAARYLNRTGNAVLSVGGQDVEVSIGQRRVVGLAIVKELFDDEGAAYEEQCKRMTELSGGGLVKDYNSFHAFTYHFASADDFCAALDAMIANMKLLGWQKAKDVVFDALLKKIGGVA